MSRQTKDRLFADFNAWGYDKKGWMSRTRREYYRRARRADEWLVEHRGVSLVFASPKDLSAFLFSTKPTAWTRNQNRSALLAFGEFLIDREIRADNPSKDLPRLPEPAQLPKAYTRAEAIRIMGAVGQLSLYSRTMVLLLLLGGLRRTEARTLEWRHVDPDARWLHFAGKGGRERAVPLRDEVSESLLLLRTQATDPRWIFPSPMLAGHPISASWMENVMDDLEDLTGIKGLHAHALRHTIATLMLEDGADIRDVQVFLGHGSIRTTVVYTKIRPARVQEAVYRVDLSAGL